VSAVASFLPQRLTLVRERRGYSCASLARKSQIAERSIRQYEAGDATPRQENLEKLSEVLDVPTTFFTGGSIELLGEDAATFRAATRLPAYRRRSALAAGALAMYFTEWIAERFDLPAVAVPDDLAGLDPELAAQATRSAWGLGNQPAPNMVHLLESKGVMVFSLAEDCRELDAFAFWRYGRPFVMLNTMKSAERGRFDAAHELGHLVLHREVGQTAKEHEEEANAFASAFLLPRQAMLATGLRHASLAQVLTVKRGWRVAATALTRRLHDVGMLTDWHYRSLMIELSKLGYRSGEPDGVEREGSQLLTGVLEALRAEGLRLPQIADELALRPDELSEMLFGLAPVLMRAR
jgi:Zn-dependent peptidase ImmA (M78 family)